MEGLYFPGRFSSRRKEIPYRKANINPRDAKGEIE